MNAVTTTPRVPRLELAQEMATRWTRQFGMAHWDVRVVVGRDMNDATAHCHVIWNYDRSLIEVQPWVLGLGAAPSPDTQADTDAAHDDRDLERLIVHEVLHAFMRRHARAHAKLAEQLPEGLQAAYAVLRHDADEEIVDILARVLVDLHRGERA